MSSAKRPGGSPLAQHYDKILLLLAMLLLTASSLFLAARFHGRFKALEASRVDEAVTQGAMAEALTSDAFQSSMKLLRSPLQVDARVAHLGVGELRVSCVNCAKPIMFAAKKCPFCGYDQPDIDDPARMDTDRDGIPDVRETELGLNPADPKDAQADSDGDLFTNLEEVQSGTDLKDATKFPPVIAKMRLREVFVKPFKLRFLSVSTLAGGDRYQLNLRTLERTYFKGMGDEVEGYKLVSFDAAAPEGPTLVVSNGRETVRLVKDQVVDAGAKTAVLVSLLDGAEKPVQIQDEFDVAGKKYKVVDINEDRVLIRDLEASSEVTIGLLTGDESLKLQGGSSRSSGEASAGASSGVLVP